MTMQALRWCARQPLPNARFRLFCSACFCWKRSQQPLPIAEATCEGCGDPCGLAWTPPSRVPSDKSSQEAGHSHRANGGTNLPGGWRSGAIQCVSPRHEHRSLQRGRVEVLAQDLPCFGGAQLAVDVTLVSALCSSGEPQPHAAEVDLPRAGRIGAMPIGRPRHRDGRSMERGSSAHGSTARHRPCPRYMTRQVSWAWERRWTRMLATTCAVAFAASLVEPSKWCDTWCHTGGTAPGSAGAGSAVVSLERYHLT